MEIVVQMVFHVQDIQLVLDHLVDPAVQVLRKDILDPQKDNHLLPDIVLPMDLLHLHLQKVFYLHRVFLDPDLDLQEIAWKEWGSCILAEPKVKKK